eukprot:CAMPEP_0115059234 /NCGR_PEP_ID=MMETSP0227-20121206/6794_1 /TAXON_ID=89957 /ORGANISM="Polarella glacialis, Strain CCMP 1383" /LENGTH=110 /DNA_ID=CAMNT_0002444313 /DNA_START=52 /DNA_END=381 /DNA_ORIENTATION=-
MSWITQLQAVLAQGKITSAKTQGAAWHVAAQPSAANPYAAGSSRHTTRPLAPIRRFPDEPPRQLADRASTAVSLHPPTTAPGPMPKAAATCGAQHGLYAVVAVVVVAVVV